MLKALFQTGIFISQQLVVVFKLWGEKEYSHRQPPYLKKVLALHDREVYMKKMRRKGLLVALPFVAFPRAI